MVAGPLLQILGGTVRLLVRNEGRSHTWANAINEVKEKNAARPTIQDVAAEAPSKKTRATKKQQAYPGDFTGKPQLSYDPHPDNKPDPGEVVWAWVPYEEDYSQGKDRPVLVIGRDNKWLLGLPMTSKDHDRDKAQENAAGRWWVDIGAGEWDAESRPSEVRVDRVIRIDPSSVRRLAGKLSKPMFNVVLVGVERHWND